MALLDVARGDDRHTAERLAAEPVIWLGTVRPDGRPHDVLSGSRGTIRWC